MRNHIECKHFPNTFSYNCLDCDKVFGTNNAYLWHKNYNICILGAVSNPEDFEKFAVKNGPGSFSCSLCTKHAAQITDIKRHIESIHFPNTFTYTCPFCSKQLGSNNAYLVHKKKCIHKYWNKCVFLGAITKPEDFEQFAIKNGSSSFSCSICSSHSSQLRDMKRHIESIHFPNTFTYSCTFCEKVFGTQNAYLNHKKIHK